MTFIRKIVSHSLTSLLFASSLLAAEGPAKFPVGEFTFQRPAGWEWIKPTSTMRAAELRVPSAKGQTDVIFFHFGPGQGGGIQANVDRWLGLFQEPRDKISAKTEEAMVGKRKVTYVQAQGTFLNGMPGGERTPMKDFALRGAIVESEQGHVFVRMTGPSEIVKTAESEFKKMVESGLK